METNFKKGTKKRTLPQKSSTKNYMECSHSVTAHHLVPGHKHCFVDPGQDPKQETLTLSHSPSSDYVYNVHMCSQGGMMLDTFKVKKHKRLFHKKCELDSCLFNFSLKSTF